MARFPGTLVNASGTPRGEVGGMAVFRGVMMLSRTGYAMAVRRRDGAIALRQVPFGRIRSHARMRTLPLVRGAAAHFDMMELGSEGMRNSEALAASTTPELPRHRRSRLALMLLSSIGALILALVFLPNLIAEIIVRVAVPDALQWMVAEESAPFPFQLIAGAVRLALLLGYVAAIGFDHEIEEVFQYHGAEHKAVLALEQGGDVTVARARVHDTIHPRCGTNFLALMCVLATFAFAGTDALLAWLLPGLMEAGFVARKGVGLLLHALAMPLVIGLSFEVLKQFAARPRNPLLRLLMAPGFLFQRLTTRQPNDQQVEVAIVALFGALAIPAGETEVQEYVVRGLEDDESAPGYQPFSPARPAATGTGLASIAAEAPTVPHEPRPDGFEPPPA